MALSSVAICYAYRSGGAEKTLEYAKKKNLKIIDLTKGRQFMPKKTYLIKNIHGRFYRSFCDNFFTTAHSKILVTDTDDLAKARKFHSLMWATHRAKFLSIKAFGYYYAFEIIGKETEPLLQVRNKRAIDKIKNSDDETMEEVQRIIDEWKTKHGLD